MYDIFDVKYPVIASDKVNLKSNYCPRCVLSIPSRLGSFERGQSWPSNSKDVTRYSTIGGCME